MKDLIVSRIRRGGNSKFQIADSFQNKNSKHLGGRFVRKYAGKPEPGLRTGYQPFAGRYLFHPDKVWKRAWNRFGSQSSYCSFMVRNNSSIRWWKQPDYKSNYRYDIGTFWQKYQAVLQYVCTNQSWEETVLWKTWKNSKRKFRDKRMDFVVFAMFNKCYWLHKWDFIKNTS